MVTRTTSVGRGSSRAFRRATAVVSVALLVLVGAAAAPTPSGEAATARYFASIRSQPSLLFVFLREMPKGGDLHNHLSGAIYAESYLRWAADDNLCLATATMTLVAATCDASAGQPPATAVLQNATLYNQAIDAMSMRNWNPAAIGHDHFFATFGKFGPASDKTGEMLAEVTARAAAEHVSYLELMLTPAGTATSRLARGIVWDPKTPNFAAIRDALLAAGFRAAVAAEAKQRLDEGEGRQRELLHCGASQADAGCRVTVRYISQVARASAPEVVFAQMLAGFEVAAQDPRVVGLNLVQPEDALPAVRDFSLQMAMLDFLHGLYPRVKVTLHAGELTDGLVPPETLRFHIRESVQTAHALRIGHGVDVTREDAALALLREMARKRVLVEIALTSNDVILGVKGTQHPLQTYLKFGVPVALVTDDAGVARSSLTLEFRKAVEEQGLDYRTLKRMVRNSIDYAFADEPTRARLRTDLESDFRAFERRTNDQRLKTND
jgi:adenosine deaminase